MAFSLEISSYSLHHYGTRPNDSDAIALIGLYNANNQGIGMIYFHKDSQELPDNSSYESMNPPRAFLRMHVSRFNTIVDMLRNEKPCHVKYYGPTNARVSTEQEPVGEEESKE